MLQDRVQENAGMQGGSPSARASSVKKAVIAGNAAIIFIVVLSLIGLYFLSNYSYLLFHNIVEIFSVAIAFSIFAIAWNTRRITDNNYFVFIGIALAFVASLSLIHTLAYKGMGVFPIYVEADLATQLWIATRYLLSFSFLLPLLFVQRKIKSVIIIASYSIATSLLLVSIFIWQNFPVAYDITTSSLTNFKIISEYTIAAILLVSIGILIKKRREFSSQIYRLLVAAMALVIAAEMAFTLYTDVYGIANMVGHLLNVASFYLIYRALVETNLTKPYDILFRNLKQSEITLASRAEELTLANERLGKEIAERKAIEEELRESQGRLEEKAAEVKDYASQMEKLAQERARQLKDAERLSAIGATAGMVGHDIRNPLQAITSELYLERLEVESLSDEVAKQNLLESIQGIETSLLYINKIVADLQDFARPLNPRREQVDVEDSVIDALTMVNLPKNIKVTVTINEQPTKLSADSTMIKRVLVNLVQNAVQAMPQGGELTIAAISRKHQIEISIEDTGEGIPKEVQDRLFTPLMTTKAKGQGFGLSVVKRMTEAMGGTVMFESEQSKGTKFTLAFPT